MGTGGQDSRFEFGGRGTNAVMVWIRQKAAKAAEDARGGNAGVTGTI